MFMTQNIETTNATPNQRDAAVEPHAFWPRLRARRWPQPPDSGVNSMTSRARNPYSKLRVLPSSDPAGSLSLMTVVWLHEVSEGVQRRRMA